MNIYIKDSNIDKYGASHLFSCPTFHSIPSKIRGFKKSMEPIFCFVLDSFSFFSCGRENNLNIIPRFRTAASGSKIYTVKEIKFKLVLYGYWKPALL